MARDELGAARRDDDAAPEAGAAADEPILAPARGTPATNLARDPVIVERVKKELVPLLARVRQDRERMREKWLRYYRIWSVTHDHQGYRGRTNTYFPVGRRWVEQWVSRLNRDCFPDAEWFRCKALRESFEARVPAKSALMAYWFRRHMRLRRHALPWLRQLVMLGSSPVRNVWRVNEREQRALRDVLDDAGAPTGRTVATVDTVADFLGPTFQPVDLFAFYVWPTTARSVDDASLAFEDMLVPRARVRALATQPLDPKRPEAGAVYEGVGDLLVRYDDAIAGRTGSSSRDAGKYEALSQRLADKGFTSPLDMTLPKALRPLDLTECMWTTDLGDGTQRYLVVLGADTDVLRVQANPFWHGGTQWLCGKFVEVEEEFYGRGLPEQFDFLQYFVNDLGNQSGDAFVWATNPIAVVDIGAVQDPTSLRMAPGAKWLANPTGVTFTQPPDGAARAGFAAVEGFLGIADTLTAPTPGGALRRPTPGADTAAGAQAALAEAAVDLRAIVEGLEDHVFVPLLERSDVLTQQCLDRDVVLKVAGADGVTFLEQAISVADLVGEYEWEWLGAVTVLNQQVRAQQMVQGMSVLAQLPADALATQQKQVDWAYVIKQYWTLGLGLPDADRVVKDTGPPAPTDWRFENALVRVGRAGELTVSPQDDHTAHAQGHTELADDERVAPEQRAALTAHVQEHIGFAIAREVQAMQQALAAATGAGGPPNPLAPGPVPAGGPPPAAPPGPGGLLGALGAAGGAAVPGGNGGGPAAPRPPAPLGPGRVGRTRGLDDLFRRLPRTPG
jgi:hypothetical protein